MGTGGRSCERARERSSLRVDGELSELEARLLDAHLRRCASCRACAADYEAIARRLRVAPPVAFVCAVAVRRRVRHGLLQLAAVAALLVVATLSGLPGAAGSRSQQLPLLPRAAAASYDLSPRGLPTTRAAALRERPPRPVPRSLALPDL